MKDPTPRERWAQLPDWAKSCVAQNPRTTQSAIDTTMKKTWKAFNDTDRSPSRDLALPQRAVPGLGPQGQGKQEDTEGRAEKQQPEYHLFL